MKDLDEIDERLKYCSQLIEQLRLEFYDFCRASISSYIDGDIGGFCSVSAEVKNPIPVSFRSKAGMIANEIRSCLDALACALALRNSKTVSGVYFPISKSEEIFQNDGMKKIRKLSEADQDLIVGLNPFRGGNDVLWMLHEADRTRKHQRLSASSAASAGLDFQDMPGALSGLAGPNASVFMTGCTVNGRAVPRLSYEAVKLAVGKIEQIGWFMGSSVPMVPMFTISYDDPEDLAGLPVMQALGNFHGAAIGVVELFRK